MGACNGKPELMPVDDEASTDAPRERPTAPARPPAVRAPPAEEEEETEAPLGPMGEDVAAALEDALDMLSVKHKHVVGIYRLSGRKDDVVALCNALAEGRTPDMSNIDPHVLACAIKMVLRERFEPLVPFALYDAVDGCVRPPAEDSEEKEPVVDCDELKVVLQRLPEVNYDMLRHLMSHLRTIVAHGADNRMSPASLATCIGVNLVRTADPTNFKDIAMRRAVVIQLIERMDYLLPPRAYDDGVTKEEEEEEEEEQEEEEDVEAVVEEVVDDIVEEAALLYEAEHTVTSSTFTLTSEDFAEDRSRRAPPAAAAAEEEEEEEEEQKATGGSGSFTMEMESLPAVAAAAPAAAATTADEDDSAATTSDGAAFTMDSEALSMLTQGLRSELAELRKHNARLQVENADLAASNRELAAELRQTQGVIGDMREELRALRESFQQSRASIGPETEEEEQEAVKEEEEEEEEEEDVAVTPPATPRFVSEQAGDADSVPSPVGSPDEGVEDRFRRLAARRRFMSRLTGTPVRKLEERSHSSGSLGVEIVQRALAKSRAELRREMELSRRKLEALSTMHTVGSVGAPPQLHQSASPRARPPPTASRVSLADLDYQPESDALKKWMIRRASPRALSSPLSPSHRYPSASADRGRPWSPSRFSRKPRLLRTSTGW